MNRVLPAGIANSSGTVPHPETPEDLALARKLTAVHRRYARQAREERRAIARLMRSAPPGPAGSVALEVPLQTREPTSLSRLVALADAMLADAGHVEP